MKIQVRFNTEKSKNESLDTPPWRALIEGVEHLAYSIRINVPCLTTEDVLPTGVTKWHITCEGTPSWSADQKSLTIN